MQHINDYKMTRLQQPPQDIVVDLSGNVNAVGVYGETVHFDPGPAYSNWQTNKGNEFIAMGSAEISAG